MPFLIVDGVIQEGADTGGASDASKAYVQARTKHIAEGLIAGNGFVVVAGEIKGVIDIPVTGTIVKVEMFSDVAATTVVDVWKDTYANYPPTNADSITAAAPPSLAAAVKSVDSTLTGWTKAVTEGDKLKFNVDANDLATWIGIKIYITPTL